MQTSTVTVAVTDPTISQTQWSEKDFKLEWFSGTGSGGQHRNKHQNSCRLIHIPSGTMQIAQTRSRENSYNEAKTKLVAALDEMDKSRHNSNVAIIRKQQVGSGERGDKIRTYRFQDNVVTNHNTGKTAPCDQVLKGKFNLLW